MAHIIITKLLSNTFLKMEPSDLKYNKKKKKGPLAAICLSERILHKLLNILLVIIIIAISMQYGDKEQVKELEEEQVKMLLDEQVKVVKVLEDKVKVLEDKQVKVLEDEQVKVLEDKVKVLEDKVKVLENKQVKVLEDEQVKVLEDKQVKVLEDKQVKVLEDEQVKVLEDKVKVLEDKVKVLEDEQVKVLEDKQVKALEDKQVKVLEDEQVKVPEDEPKPVTPEPEPVTPEPEPVTPEPEPVTPCQQILTPPNKRLHEFHHGCNTDGKSRHPDCVAAMSRYCNNIQFSCNRPVHAITAVSQEHANGWIVFGCIESTYAGPVLMSTIHHLHGGCRHGNSQSMDCLAATHRFCTEGHAGLTQEVAASDSLWVTCFKASLEQMVSIEELQAMHYPCSMGTSNSDDCFAAASRWCTSRGHNGGITQEATENHIHVVCFKSLHDASAFV